MKFFYYWFSCFNVMESKKLVEQIEEIHSKSNSTDVDHPAMGKNVSDLKIVHTELLPSIMNKFYSRVEDINEECYGFDLYKRLPKSIHLNYYRDENLADYPFHMDGVTLGSYNEMKLTGIINLSREKYLGGQFQLLINENNPIIVDEINTIGNAIIFPSFILHKVTPITKGERISLSTWFYGPNWK